jgi:hypothetical protein
MNEQERRVNQGLHALDEAHRTGRLTREVYRARRRALLGGLCDSDGVTARNALTPSAAAQSPPFIERRVSGPMGDAVGMLFPDRRRLVWKLWLGAFLGLGLVALLLYGALQLGQA